MNGEYYINIPSKVLKNRDLKFRSKILYGEISRLSQKDGYCYASNKYLGELLGIHEKSVSRLIKELISANLVKMTETSECGLTKRCLYII